MQGGLKEGQLSLLATLNTSVLLVLASPEMEAGARLWQPREG